MSKEIDDFEVVGGHQDPITIDSAMLQELRMKIETGYIHGHTKPAGECKDCTYSFPRNKPKKD